jgi:hypothetical protein
MQGGDMKGWQYRVTVHDADEIIALVSEPVGEVPPMVFCDDEGACYFSSGPNPYTQAIEGVLNQAGDAEWELIQVTFRPHQMIGFWKKPRE